MLKHTEKHSSLRLTLMHTSALLYQAATTAAVLLYVLLIMLCERVLLLCRPFVNPYRCTGSGLHENNKPGRRS